MSSNVQKPTATLNHDSVKLEKWHRKQLHHKRGLLQSVRKVIAQVMAKEKANAS